MKRWAIVTVLLYALLLVVLTAPVLYLAMGSWWGHPASGGGISLTEAFKPYQAWGYWVCVAVLLLGQALLLLVPVDVSQRRLTPRRKLLVPVITSAFLFANVFFGALFSLACAIAGDGALKALSMFGDEDPGPWLSLALITSVLWLIWGVIFYRATRAGEPQEAAARLLRWLLKGSILELLVAVPSHIIVRNREVCCAPAGSFWGIATGLSVMLLCYGPGVFFLFVDRMQRRQPKP